MKCFPPDIGMSAKTRKHIMKSKLTSIFCAAALFCFTPVAAFATSVTYSVNPTADTFVTNGSANGAGPNDNYGAAGSLMVAGSASGNGTFESLLQFNLSAATAQFNTQLGVGDWTLSNIL